MEPPRCSPRGSWISRRRSTREGASDASTRDSWPTEKQIKNTSRFMNHRVPAHRRYQPTEYEHAANCATHALWIIPSILGSSNLYFLSDDDWETISAWIYGLGLCGLFVVSTVFHTISWKKSHLRTVEHCLHMSDRMVIYFFIAASYAPWLNLRELGPWASHMRWLVWIMASVGTVYVFFFHERYKLVELLCYVVVGFLPALVILSMVSCPHPAWGLPSGSRGPTVALEIVRLNLLLWQTRDLWPGVSVTWVLRQENVQLTPGLGSPVLRHLLSLLHLQ
ncbi:monocyte to macrophage differentiation factor 2 [Physeter macrocephalus]|uniref:Monocyte to macrophage differentiation factor 2 n=1 Tax=Physeter macrocephalus TaxID=9755 RepID=A0A2Y9SHW7_PHYMC|nr:monocyte to macrophage differentiation factor 2 [Physeter catodon]|eukprot:XP_023975319.1 monocyte to macrophage differentiation factor 2 isoform X1 [Physeter catodon]